MSIYKGSQKVMGIVASQGEADLTEYQKKNDLTLNTTDKTVSGAINELKEAIDNGGNTITKVSELENDSGFISTTIADGSGIVQFTTMPSNVTSINGGCYASYAIKGGWCFADFTVGITKVSSSASNYTVVGTDFPPALKTLYIPLHSEKGVTGTSFTISINNSGQIKLMVSGNTLSAQDFYLGFITYPVKES